MKKNCLLFTGFVFLGLASGAQADYEYTSTPHNATAAGAPIACAACHATSPSVAEAVADTTCLGCHTNKTGRNFLADSAPFVMTHAKSTTSSRRMDWHQSCTDCHRLHPEPPSTLPLVTGQYTGYSAVSWTDPRTGASTQGTTLTYRNASASDPAWSTPDSWITKDSFQVPYNPDADPNSPGWSTSPCNPANIGPSNPPDVSLCEPGIPPGERGLNLWVTYTDGAKGVFEITAASANEIVVTGRIPADKTLAYSGTFELHYGMLISNAPLYDHDKDPATPKVPVSTPVEFSGHFQDFSSLAYNERIAGADPDPTPNGICQVCHVDTKFWRQDGTLTNHNNGQVCTTCHKHEMGFTGPGSCNCHNIPPSQGAHGKHASVAGYHFPCTSCHSGPDTMAKWFIGGGNIDIGFDPTGYYPSNSGFPTGMYDNPDDSSDDTLFKQRDLVYYGVQGKNYKGDFGWSPATPSVYDPTNFPFGTKVVTVPTTDPKAKTCQNVYCHSQGKLLANGFETPSLSPSWDKTWANGGDPQNDGNTCNNCHAYPPTFDCHSLHASRGIECYHCHYDTVYKDLADGGKMKIKDTTRHVNGAYNVMAGGEFILRSYPPKRIPVSFDYTYAPGGGSCSSNTCHVQVGYQKPLCPTCPPPTKKWCSSKSVLQATIAISQTGSCEKGASSSTVSATINTTSREALPPFTYEINWGDGSPLSTTTTNSKTWTVPHTYYDKVPGAYETDPAKGVIGTWQATWTVRDVYGNTLDTQDGTGVKPVLIDVCPVPNVAPVPKFSIVNTDYAGAPPYEVELTDLSTDADYNMNQHYDPTGAKPGTIKIEWGGYAATDRSKKGVYEGKLELTNAPSGKKYRFAYYTDGYAAIKHCIKDNDAASNFICSPTLIHYVSR